MTQKPVSQSINHEKSVAVHGHFPGRGPIDAVTGYKGGTHDVDLCSGVTTELAFHFPQWNLTRTRSEAIAGHQDLFDDLVDALHDFANLEMALLHQTTQGSSAYPVVPHQLAAPKWPIDVFAGGVRGRPLGEVTRVDITDYWWYVANAGSQKFLGPWVSQSPGGSESVARSRSMWFEYFFAERNSPPRLDIDFAVPGYAVPVSEIFREGIAGFVTAKDVPLIVASQLRKLLWRHELLSSATGLPTVELHCELGTQTNTGFAPVTRLVLPLLK